MHRALNAARAGISNARSAGVTDRAAGLSYYAALSILPAVVVLVALLGLVGDRGTARTLLDAVRSVGPDSAVGILRGPVRRLVTDDGAAGVVLAVSLGGALWAASGYVGGFIRAANEVGGLYDPRSKWRLLCVRVGLTVLTLLTLTGMLAVIALSGPLLRAAADGLGIGWWADVWAALRWPLLALAGGGVIAALYRFAPAAMDRDRGAIVLASSATLLVWVLVSAGFGLYVANLGSYDAVYGSLAGVIVFLIWLWLSNVLVLVGVAVAGELARQAPARARERATRAHEPLVTGR